MRDIEENAKVITKKHVENKLQKDIKIKSFKKRKSV